MKSKWFSDVKRFMVYILRRSYALQALALVLLFGFIVYQAQINQIIIKEIKSVEKKVDFRYFNLTRSLESIYNIEIDTKDGRVRK